MQISSISLPPQPAAYKIRDVAFLLGVAPSSVRRLIDRGELKACRAFRHVLVPATEISKLLTHCADERRQ